MRYCLWMYRDVQDGTRYLDFTCQVKNIHSVHNEGVLRLIDRCLQNQSFSVAGLIKSYVAKTILSTYPTKCLFHHLYCLHIGHSYRDLSGLASDPSLYYPTGASLPGNRTLARVLARCGMANGLLQNTI